MCNPLNINYKYQFNLDYKTQAIKVAREAADPSLILFEGKYYLFASMTLSVYVSDDLVTWTQHPLPKKLPLYDYAPDARVMGEYVYFSASKRGEICDFYRTKDVLNGPYEKIEGTFDFYDPNLFMDDDKRVYFYYGCTNGEPLWGDELNAMTMQAIHEKTALLEGNPFRVGYERVGENHSEYPKTEAEIDQAFQYFLQAQNMKEDALSNVDRHLLRNMLSNQPYIEGAWMSKHKGRYYLQYAAPGTQYNGYADGVYVSDYPLGPFEFAKNNPYSYKPSGFIQGAGHGSTLEDKYGNLWHASTSRISINHNFERRLGLWPAGFDEDGELFCNQNYGDFPRPIVQGPMDPWEDPKWMLLSYQKDVKASSEKGENTANKCVDENIQTWWQADEKNPWVEVDLGMLSDVKAIQINFADDLIDVEIPGELIGSNQMQKRYIDDANHKTRWILEASEDGIHYEVLEDKSKVQTDLSHDLVVNEKGIKARYIKLTILEVPYDQKPSLSGLRIFGTQDIELPKIPDFAVERVSDLDMNVKIDGNALGYNVLWGHQEDKLYHSALSFSNHIKIAALVKDESYFVRVDAFNEKGITKGTVKPL